MCLCLHLPEWSSLTSDDTVLVMESAATRRSFLRFLLEAEEEKRDRKEDKSYSKMQAEKIQLNLTFGGNKMLISLKLL